MCQLMPLQCFLFVPVACADPEGGGGRGFGPPPEKSQNKGFLSNTGPDPLKKSQSYQASIQRWAIIGPPAKRHMTMMTRF